MDKKITKVEIITRADKFEPLKEALNQIGVEGMTVSQVYGCGLQKGHKEIYRGREYEIHLVPNIKLETVICDVPVEQLLETARAVLCTGKVGDGKIFVYTLDNAMRIRTGTQGSRAITDNEEV